MTDNCKKESSGLALSSDFLREIESYEVKKGVVLWSLGGAGFVLKTPQSLVYIDPFLAESDDPDFQRAIPVPIDPGKIKVAHAVLSTHCHIDHCDKETLTAMEKNTRSIFVGPVSSTQKMAEWGIKNAKTKIIKPYQKLKLRDINIVTLPGDDPGDKEAVNYLLQVDGITLFDNGDSHYFPGYLEIAKKWNIDIAIINFGKEIYMDANDIVKAATDLRTKILIPMHWDLWKNYTEDPGKIEKIVRSRSLGMRIEVLRLGDRFEYAK